MRTNSSYTPTEQEKFGSSTTTGSTSTATEEESSETIYKGIIGKIREEDGAISQRVRFSTEEEIERGGWFETTG